LARVILILPREWLPFKKPFDAEPWVETLAERAQGLPVLFENSYRDASHYRFYTNDAPAWTFTDVHYRLNQFDIWQNDTTFHNQRVLVVGKENWEFPGISPFKTQGKNNYTLVVDSFQITKGVQFILPELPDTLQKGKTIPIMVKMIRTSAGAKRVKGQPSGFGNKLTIGMNAPLPLDLHAIFQYVGDGWQYKALRPLTTTILLGNNIEQTIYKGNLYIPKDLPDGEVLFQLGLGYRGMPPLRGQSALRPVIVKD